MSDHPDLCPDCRRPICGCGWHLPKFAGMYSEGLPVGDVVTVLTVCPKCGEEWNHEIEVVGPPESVDARAN